MAKRRRPIHANIARLRKNKKLSQSELAVLVEVDETAVSHWERGRSAPKGARLPLVADALGVTLDELLREAA